MDIVIAVYGCILWHGCTLLFYDMGTVMLHSYDSQREGLHIA